MIDANDFWTDLDEAVSHAETLDVKDAAFMTALFLDEYRGAWPHIERDMIADLERRTLFDYALSIRDR